MPVLLLVVFINFVGIGALIPVLPYTVIETLGLSATVMTLLLASFAFAMFLSNPLLGRLSDYIGRRPVLIVSLGVNVLAHIWFAFSSDIVQMFAARILAGLAAGNTGVIQAMIADRVAAKAPAEKAPPAPLGVRIMMVLRSELALYALAFFCLNLSFAQVEASYILLLRDYLGFGATQTGWLFTYIGVCIVLVQAGFINIAVKWFGEVGTVGFGASLLLFGQIITALLSVGFLIGDAYPLAQIVLTTTAVCFGFGFSNPALSAAASNAAGKQQWAVRLARFRALPRLGRWLDWFWPALYTSLADRIILLALVPVSHLFC